jgi:O-methyltransferase
MVDYAAEFLAEHGKLGTRTLVDLDRCHDLWQLVTQACKVKGDIIEVGVWRGGTGFLLCRRAAQSSATKNVYLCDTFTGVVKAGEKDNTYVGGEHADADVHGVIGFLSSNDLVNYRIVRGIFPDETGPMLCDLEFCMAHIDVDVYHSAKDAFDFVWRRMPVGGIVVFDDYLWPPCEGITTLVDEIRASIGNVFIHTVPYHAVFIKTA